MQAPSLEVMSLYVALGSLAVAILAAVAAKQSASASKRSASEATRTNDIAIHGLRCAIYEDVMWMRSKVIGTPLGIGREDILKFYNSVRYSRLYFGDTAHSQLLKFLNAIDKYQSAEFREQLSKQEVVSELRGLADLARDAIEPHMSLIR